MAMSSLGLKIYGHGKCGVFVCKYHCLVFDGIEYLTKFTVYV